jgi:hypothetical protein
LYFQRIRDGFTLEVGCFQVTAAANSSAAPGGIEVRGERSSEEAGRGGRPAIENGDYAERSSMTLAELLQGLMNTQEASILGVEKIFAMEIKLSDANQVVSAEIANGPDGVHSIYFSDKD